MNNKLTKILAIILVLIMLLVGTSAHVLADFGDFSGDTDYGGGYDDDYDDYDDDYSYDDDDDYVYGSIYDSSGGSGGSVTSDEEPGWGEFILFILIFGLPIFLYLRGLFKRAKSANLADAKRRGTPGAAPLSTELKPVDEIRKWDPAFSEDEITERLSSLYVRMQNCWTARDITPLRGDFTDSQFAQYSGQLKRYNDARQTNMIERIAVLGVDLLGVRQDDKYDILVANLSTRITTYVTDDKTGEVLRGSPDEEKFMQYEWSLVRPRGSQTVPRSGNTAFNCPSCAAPMNINQSAQCPYCGSVVTRSEFDWVIAGIKGLSQQTS